MNVFQDYAKYYDLLYQDKDYQQEADYVHKLLQLYAKPKSLLELGSGTGKHAKALSQLGYDITGIDQSAQMLEMAGNLCQEGRFIQGDIRDVQVQTPVDAAISLFHVMSYQVTNADWVEVFTAVKKQVKPGGLFIFDCWYGPAVLTQKPETRYKTLENQQMRVERVAVPTVNENQNTVLVEYHLYVQQNKIYQKLYEKHLMRYLFLPEILLMCEQFDMKLLNHEEWITQKLLSTNTWGACFVVQT